MLWTYRLHSVTLVELPYRNTPNACAVMPEFPRPTISRSAMMYGPTAELTLMMSIASWPDGVTRMGLNPEPPHPATYDVTATPPPTTVRLVFVMLVLVTPKLPPWHRTKRSPLFAATIFCLIFSQVCQAAAGDVPARPSLPVVHPACAPDPQSHA